MQASSGVGRIDVHAHFLPDRYRAELAAAGHSRPAGMPAIPEWSVSRHLEMMDRFDIASSLLSISAPGLHFGDDAAARSLARHVNEEGARAVQAHPSRFGLFAALPLPDIDGALAELDHAFGALNADGVILETHFHGLYLGDERLDPVFAELDRRGACVLIHPTKPHCPCCQDPAALPPIGYPFPMIEFTFETARAVFKLLLTGTLARFPNVRFIVPHAGATVPVLSDRVAGFAPVIGLADPPGVPQFFEQLRGLYYDLAGFATPRQLQPLLSIADPKHLLYGSDWPYTPAALVGPLAQALDANPLLAGALHADAMRRNALALFPRFGATA